jgi:hypothetical protein
MSYPAYCGGDPADYPQASIGFDFDAIDERLLASERNSHPGPAAESVNANIEKLIAMRAADAVMQVIARILDSHDPRLEANILAAASGLALCAGWSYTEMAKQYGISKQAFDKRVLKCQKDFKFPATRAQKSLRARLSYQQTQLDRIDRLERLKQHNNERNTQYGRVCQERNQGSSWKNDEG